MKIALVSPYDWNYPGGVRDHILNLSDQFIQMDHDVRILAPGPGTKGKLSEAHIYNMGRTIPFPINGSIARITFVPALTWRVRRVLQREHFDVIHVHEPLVPGLSLTVLRLSRTLTVGTFHAFAKPGMTSTPYLAYASAYPFLRRYFRHLAGRIAVSHAAYQFVSHYFPGDYRIIPNGIDLQRFNPHIMPLPQFMDGKWNILFVGRFEKRKGAKYLLRAIPAIRERHPNTRFIFVGEGRLRAGFQRFVEQAGWPDVVFTGYVSDDEKPRYFASSHVFCAPATGGESMGMVLLESMASGTPVVASNIPGYATVINSGTDGLLTPPRDSEELASAVSTLLENEPLRQRLMHTGLQKVRDYAWPQVARRVMDYYCWLFEQRLTG
jgi:phosphatidyl-myo-inositol alpha-mannosyltransferase